MGQHLIFPKYLRKKSGYLLLPCVGNSFIFGSLVGAYYLQAVFMLGEFCADLVPLFQKKSMVYWRHDCSHRGISGLCWLEASWLLFHFRLATWLIWMASGLPSLRKGWNLFLHFVSVHLILLYAGFCSCILYQHMKRHWGMNSFLPSISG